MPQQERTREDHCGTCSDGFYLEDGDCLPYPGGCVNGEDLEQRERTGGAQCSACAAGFGLSDDATCEALSGACANGTPVEEGARTKPEECAACDAGFYLDDGKCLPYSGGCPGGYLMPLALRTQHDHCAECRPGFVLEVAAFVDPHLVERCASEMGGAITTSSFETPCLGETLTPFALAVWSDLVFVCCYDGHVVQVGVHPPPPPRRRRGVR